MMAEFQIISQMKPASNVKEKQDNEAFKNLQPKNRFDILYKKRAVARTPKGHYV